MTGPGPGKIRLNAIVEIRWNSNSILVNDIEVYLHLKGWSRAFVTHLDLESNLMNEYIAKPKMGFYARAEFRHIGLLIYALKAIRPCVIRIKEDVVLSKAFSIGDKTWCYIGGKEGGIFIGFRREYLRKMEEIARLNWGIEPKSRKG